MEVFVIGDGRSFLTELVTFHACSCRLWSDGYPVGLGASSIPMLAANGARRRSNLPNRVLSRNEFFGGKMVRGKYALGRGLGPFPPGKC